MSKTYGYVKARLSQRLQDPSLVNYTDADRQKAVYTAVQAIIAVRPDACQKVEWVNLTASETSQTLTVADSDSAGNPNRIFDILQFKLNSGTPIGGAKRVERGALDTYHPNWRSDTGALPREWFFDDRSPVAFHVYPPTPGSGTYQALVRYSYTPAVISGDSDLVGVDDIYLPALEEYALFLLWGGDRETSPNYVRAKAAFEAFERIMGVKAQADAAVSPKVGAQLR